MALITKNIPAFENVADMSALPPTGATVIALPMKIEDGSGGPPQGLLAGIGTRRNRLYMTGATPSVSSVPMSRPEAMTTARL